MNRYLTPTTWQTLGLCLIFFGLQVAAGLDDPLYILLAGLAIIGAGAYCIERGQS